MNRDPDVLPVLTDDLIKELDRSYPEKSPHPDDKERHIWMYAGKRELIRVLKSRKQYTEEQAYKE